MLQPSGNTQRLASRIADSLARGRPPASSAALDAFLAAPDEEIYAALDAFERHVMTGTERTQVLAEAYLFLIQTKLEHLRYEIDAGHERAKAVVTEFQLALAEHVRSGRLDGGALPMIGRALREAKLDAIPELLDAGGASAAPGAPDEAKDLPRAMEALVDQFVELGGDDPYAICAAIAEGAFTLPPQVKGAIVSMFLARRSGAAQEAAALMILDGSAEVRREVALALLANAELMSPASLRRLIALRNWLPADEHHFVDQAVRAARENGVECAPWPARPPASIYSSGIDGSGAQGFLITSPEGKQTRLSSILVKRNKGIQDAWCGEPMTKGEAGQHLRYAKSEGMLHPVSRTLLELMVQHHIAAGLGLDKLPPAELLQVAEILGGADWQPRPLEWQAVLAGLLAEAPAASLGPEAVARTLDESAVWSALGGLEDSWFEDDDETAGMIAGTRRRSPARLVDDLLRTLIVRRSPKWAEYFTWVALWLRHVQPNADARWSRFAVLARALAERCDVPAIPLMADIAARTVVAHTRPMASITTIPARQRRARGAPA